MHESRKKHQEKSWEDIITALRMLGLDDEKIKQLSEKLELVISSILDEDLKEFMDESYITK